ncbi:symmetrical bis(5'-nucleosyl)-tetraphosphatase [Shewanella avicenniae]|uniref:bis(5'-nucleosyl)-tetraphosphatase (symmetrical) n=1 Tax=Shewanella avicenniae TaxID=2814294 RepID=A0ABX7QQ15_9GAMM|nr:symmetrical bis(5'-nucleosyl)-tetraphosphatase [Shewanella avicenniae]QSX33026.1 symmetrical bis(5'-nucleosyl)-tetraphosphatase [Shewanella avicenniae]
MANYFVGDIQGCFNELRLLLDRVSFNPSKDVLWAVGDLVARGPDSLATLRFFESLDNAGRVVLGNHDLNLLSVHAGIRRAKSGDKLTRLLESKDINKLIDWLRQQPLLHELPAHNLVMTHAGIPPQWDIATARAEAAAVSAALQQPDYVEAILQKMYTNTPEGWDPALSGFARLRYCINALTRMRYLFADGQLDFECKLPPARGRNPELTPWYDVPARSSGTLKVFGHWAALMGQRTNPEILPLDTGCCWGEFMTMWHLEANQFITQAALK